MVEVNKLSILLINYIEKVYKIVLLMENNMITYPLILQIPKRKTRLYFFRKHKVINLNKFDNIMKLFEST